MNWGICPICNKGLMRNKRVGILKIMVQCNNCKYNDLLEKPTGWKATYMKIQNKEK